MQIIFQIFLSSFFTKALFIIVQILTFQMKHSNKLTSSHSNSFYKVLQTPFDSKLQTTPGQHGIANTNQNPLSLIDSSGYHQRVRRSDDQAEPFREITQNWNESGGKPSMELLKSALNQQQQSSDDLEQFANQIEEGGQNDVEEASPVKLNLDLNTIKKMRIVPLEFRFKQKILMSIRSDQHLNNNESISKSNATANQKHDQSCTPYSVMMFQDRFNKTNQSIESVQSSQNIYNGSNLKVAQTMSSNHKSSMQSPGSVLRNNDQNNQILNVLKQYLNQLSLESSVYLSDHFYDQIVARNLQEIEPQLQSEFLCKLSPDQIKFNEKNKLLSIVDAGLKDRQVHFVLQTLEIMIKALGNQIQMRGMNLNGNTELTDSSLRSCIQLVKKVDSIKVLSIERFKVSHQAIQNLFNQLPETKIVELNISGIPLNFVCIDTLCQVLENKKPHIRVLHVRNTKMQDSSALRLMEQIIVRKSKVKYLGMSMNSLLGFQFQNGVVKMLRESARDNQKHHIKLLDLKHCNINKANLLVIQKLVAYNNGQLADQEDVNKLLYSQKTNKSAKSLRSMRNDSHSQTRSINKARRSCDPNIGSISTPQLVSLNQRSQSILESRNNMELSLGKHLVNSTLIRSQMINSRDQQPNASAYKDQDSIQEIIIQQDDGSSQINAFNTGQSLTKKDRQWQSNLNASMGKQIKYSKSCSRQNKSKSLNDIIGGGVVNNKQNHPHAESLMPIIKNLTKLDRIEKMNGGDGVSIVDSVRKVVPNTDHEQQYKPKPFKMSSPSERSINNKSRQSLDLGRNSSYRQVHEAYGSQERLLMDQTFQKKPNDLPEHFQSIQPETNLPFSLNASIEIPHQQARVQRRKSKQTKKRSRSGKSLSQKRTPRQIKMDNYTSAKMLDRKVTISVQQLDRVQRGMEKQPNNDNSRSKSLSGHQGYTFSKSTRTFQINDQTILDKLDISDHHSKSSLGTRSNNMNRSRPQIDAQAEPLNLIIGPHTSNENNQYPIAFSRLLSQMIPSQKRSTRFIQKRDSQASIKTTQTRQEKRKQPVQKPSQNQRRGFHVQSIDMQNNYLRKPSHERTRSRQFQQQFVPAISAHHGHQLPASIHSQDNKNIMVIQKMPNTHNSRSIRTSIQTTMPNSNLPSQRAMAKQPPTQNGQGKIQGANQVQRREPILHHNQLHIRELNLDTNATPEVTFHNHVPSELELLAQAQNDLKQIKEPKYCPMHDPSRGLHVLIDNDDQTKSCSEYSVSPINSQHQQPLKDGFVEKVLPDNTIETSSGQQANDQNFGGLKDMIKDEISRLETLYKSIDILMLQQQNQPDQHQAPDSLAISSDKKQQRNKKSFQFIKQQLPEKKNRVDTYDQLYAKQQDQGKLQPKHSSMYQIKQNQPTDHTGRSQMSSATTSGILPRHRQSQQIQASNHLRAGYY